MISKLGRSRLIYCLMSMLVTWHTAAMIIAPAPKSYATDALRGVFGPYLEFFGLDNRWDFYAPVVGYGRIFRVVVEDREGIHHEFTPIDDVSWYLPSYWWFSAWYEAIWRTPQAFKDAYVATVCEKYRSLHPVSVRLIGIQQNDFTPEDYFNGHQPLDADFVTQTELGEARCPG
jgi:hypothetical protein